MQALSDSQKHRLKFLLEENLRPNDLREAPWTALERIGRCLAREMLESGDPAMKRMVWFATSQTGLDRAIWSRELGVRRSPRETP